MSFAFVSPPLPPGSTPSPQASPVFQRNAIEQLELQLFDPYVRIDHKLVCLDELLNSPGWNGHQSIPLEHWGDYIYYSYNLPNLRVNLTKVPPFIWRHLNHYHQTPAQTDVEALKNHQIFKSLYSVYGGLSYDMFEVNARELLRDPLFIANPTFNLLLETYAGRFSLLSPQRMLFMVLEAKTENEVLDINFWSLVYSKFTPPTWIAVLQELSEDELFSLFFVDENSKGPFQKIFKKHFEAFKTSTESTKDLASFLKDEIQILLDREETLNEKIGGLDALAKETFEKLIIAASDFSQLHLAVSTHPLFHVLEDMRKIELGFHPFQKFNQQQVLKYNALSKLANVHQKMSYARLRQDRGASCTDYIYKPRYDCLELFDHALHAMSTAPGYSLPEIYAQNKYLAFLALMQASDCYKMLQENLPNI